MGDFMTDIIGISFKTVLRDKMTKIIILIMSIVFFIGTIISIYQKGIEDNVIHNYSKDDYYARILMVGKSGNIEEHIEELKNIDHIQTVLKMYDLPLVKFKSEDFKTKNTDGKFVAYTADNNSLPKLTAGIEFPDNEGLYLICPEVMYANLTLYGNSYVTKITNKDRINIKKYLNKTLSFSYTAYDENGEMFNKSINVKMIGTYKASETNLNDNVCFMNENLKKTVYYEAYSFKEKEYDYEEMPLMLVVDSFQNMDEVLKKLESLEYGYNKLVVDIPDYLEELDNSMTIFSSIILLINLCLIVILFNMFFNRNLRNLKLYKFLGYSNKNIKFINLFCNIIIALIAFLVSIILSVVYKYLMELIIYYRPFIFSKYEIIFSIKYLIYISSISFVFIILVSLFNNKFLSKKLEEHE